MWTIANNRKLKVYRHPARYLVLLYERCRNDIFSEWKNIAADQFEHFAAQPVRRRAVAKNELPKGRCVHAVRNDSRNQYILLWRNAGSNLEKHGDCLSRWALASPWVAVHGAATTADLKRWVDIQTFRHWRWSPLRAKIIFTAQRLAAYTVGVVFECAIVRHWVGRCPSHHKQKIDVFSRVAIPMSGDGCPKTTNTNRLHVRSSMFGNGCPAAFTACNSGGFWCEFRHGGCLSCHKRRLHRP